MDPIDNVDNTFQNLEIFSHILGKLFGPILPFVAFHIFLDDRRAQIGLKMLFYKCNITGRARFYMNKSNCVECNWLFLFYKWKINYIYWILPCDGWFLSLPIWMFPIISLNKYWINHRILSEKHIKEEQILFLRWT